MDPIKAKIIELCPDVMELKFGCQIQLHGQNHAPRFFVRNGGRKRIGTQSYWFNNGYTYEREEFEILGSPITLAVVLRAIGKVEAEDGYEPFVMASGLMGVIKDAGLRSNDSQFHKHGVFWNLTKDNYDEQSQETKDFIGTLLNV